MNAPAEGRLGWTLVRTAQFLLDPFVTMLPGAAELAQRAGLSGNTAPFVTSQRLDRGLVLLLPGIEGPSLYARSIRQGLATVRGAVRMCNWSGVWPGMFAAFSSRYRDRCVDRLVEDIRAYRREYPGRPVVMIGHSGGAAISIATAERLGPAEHLKGIVAMATPLHPEYDLSVSLTGTRRMLTTHSRGDIQLKALTGIGGNFDRRFGGTAGQAGFQFPADDRLTQFGWDRSMTKFNHSGGHVGCASARWVRKFIAPVVSRWLQEPA